MPSDLGLKATARGARRPDPCDDVRRRPQSATMTLAPETLYRAAGADVRRVPVPLGNTIPALACSFSTRGNSLNGAWDDPSMWLSIVTTVVRNLIKVPAAVLRSCLA